MVDVNFPLISALDQAFNSFISSTNNMQTSGTSARQQIFTPRPITVITPRQILNPYSRQRQPMQSIVSNPTPSFSNAAYNYQLNSLNYHRHTTAAANSAGNIQFILIPTQIYQVPMPQAPSPAIQWNRPAPACTPNYNPMRTPLMSFQNANPTTQSSSVPSCQNSGVVQRTQHNPRAQTDFQARVAVETKSDVLTSSIKPPPPLAKSQYKMTADGSFQCLIQNERGANKGTVCNAIFAQRSSLSRHKRDFHDNYKPLKCPSKGCSLSFSAYHLLKIHLRVHSGERPFKCDYKGCTKAFKQRSHLTEHKRIHTGEKPYLCNYCTSRFSRKSVRDTHQRIHTGEKPYKCRLCATAFTQYASYKRHEKNRICVKRKKRLKRGSKKV